jgi:RNA polymerase sigma-70 factor, ECF subfamily
MPANKVVEAIFRDDSQRILITLTRVSGSVDRAEDALQDALASALISWPQAGIPKNAAAWVMAAAHRRLIDALRRERTKRISLASILNDGAMYGNRGRSEDRVSGDSDRALGLIFACCHWELNHSTRLALALRTLGGLTTREIARALSVSEVNIAQRLVRAKRKIREGRIPFDATLRRGSDDCMRSVREVIYQIFKEAFRAGALDRPGWPDGGAKAIELGRALCRLVPEDAESRALLALMLLKRAELLVSPQKAAIQPDQARPQSKTADLNEAAKLLDQSKVLSAIGPYQREARAVIRMCLGTLAEPTKMSFLPLHEPRSIRPKHAHLG